MRSILGIILFIGFGAASVATADPSASEATPAATAAPATPAQGAAPRQSTAPAQPAAPTAAAQPAAPANAAPAESSATATEDEREKHFLSEGYRLEMRNGEKVFCRREDVLGTRLGARKVCSTALQLTQTENEARASANRSMMQQNNPGGR